MIMKSATIGRGVKPRVNYQGIANACLLTALLLALAAIIWQGVK